MLLGSTTNNAASGGATLGTSNVFNDLAISNGLFAVTLDFGAQFDGNPRWLQIAVRPGASTGAYTNVAPRQVGNVIRAALDGNRDLARKLDAQLQRLHKAMFLESNPIPVKWALAELGLIDEGIRLPLVPLDPAFHDDVRAALRAAGLI